MFKAIIALLVVSSYVVAFNSPAARMHSTSKLAMSSLDAKSEAGVSGPLGFFDPLGLAPTNKRDFAKYREAELKHGRVAMVAFLGLIIGESGLTFFSDSISGPAIYQYQQADSFFNAFSANVIGLTLAIEGFNIVKGWESPNETSAAGETVASLKDGYVAGNLGFDPLGLGSTSADKFKIQRTKELNNGRLAMLGVAGIIAQELVTGEKLF